MYWWKTHRMWHDTADDIGWRRNPHYMLSIMLREWIRGNLINYYLHTPEGKPYRLTGAMP